MSIFHRAPKIPKNQGRVGPRDNGDTSPLAIKPAADTWRRIASLVTARKTRTDPAKPARDGLNCGPAEEDIQEPAKALCSVGMAGVNIDPHGNVQV